MSNAYDQALTMTEPTPNMENKPVTTEATIDAGKLLNIVTSDHGVTLFIRGFSINTHKYTRSNRRG